jgi:beta-lactamase class A
MRFLVTFFLLCSLTTAFATKPTTDNTRIGYCYLNENTEVMRESLGDEAFPMQSTFKLALVGAVLAHADHNPKWLNQTIQIHQANLVEWSPITEKYLNQHITIKQLAEAALRYSDNTAANLLLDQIGGPEALNRFAPELYLVHHEPNLSSHPNTKTDISTPCGMLFRLRVLLNSPKLSNNSRAQLKQWLLTNTTGNKRIRSGVPKGWSVGDKTGTGSYGVTNDIAVIYPPKAKPIYLAIYRVSDQIDAKHDEQALADLTHTLLSNLK